MHIFWNSILTFNEILNWADIYHFGPRIFTHFRKFDLIYRFVRECENFYAQRNMDRKQNVKQISMIEEYVLLKQYILYTVLVE